MNGKFCVVERHFMLDEQDDESFAKPVIASKREIVTRRPKKPAAALSMTSATNMVKESQPEAPVGIKQNIDSNKIKEKRPLKPSIKLQLTGFDYIK